MSRISLLKPSSLWPSCRISSLTAAPDEGAHTLEAAGTASSDSIRDVDGVVWMQAYYVGAGSLNCIWTQIRSNDMRCPNDQGDGAWLQASCPSPLPRRDRQVGQTRLCNVTYLMQVDAPGAIYMLAVCFSDISRHLGAPSRDSDGLGLANGLGRANGLGLARLKMPASVSPFS